MCCPRPVFQPPLSPSHPISLPCYEFFEAYLDEQEEVWVLTLGGGSSTVLDVVLLDVDTPNSRNKGLA